MDCNLSIFNVADQLFTCQFFVKKKKNNTCAPPPGTTNNFEKCKWKKLNRIYL